ncbi:MAG: hypothetical protein REI11_06545 [Patulibacter sp.]|nr:hypothetical protein [Patulibacter sp.]
MRTLPVVPSLLALLVLAPVASAAPSYDPSTGIYSVSNGADLETAVTQARSTGTTAKPAVIDLDDSTTIDGFGQTVPHQYTLSGTLTITSADHVRIQSASQELSAVAAAAATPPTISRTGAGMALDLTGAGNTFRGVTIAEPSSATGTSTTPLVRVGGGASLGTPGTSSGVAVTTNTSPGVSVTGSATVSGVVFAGGGPAVDVNTASSSGAQLVTIDGTRLLSGAASIVRVAGGSAASTVHIRNSQFRGSDEATLVDVDGAAAGGSLNVDVTTSTFAAGGTGIAVHPGTETTATKVSAVGVFGDGVATMLACSGSGTPATVAIDYSAWTGTTSPGSACSLATPIGRVSNADPDRKIDDNTGAPAWNSPLVDHVPVTAGSTVDVNGNPRTSVGPRTPGATPVDVGADEYQYGAPTLTPTFANADALGTVTFSASTSDNDDLYDAENSVFTPVSTISWAFPDGSTQTGSTASFRFGANVATAVTVTATDPTGLTTTKTLSTSPDRSAVPLPTPTPTPTPTPVDTSGQGTAPTPTPIPTPKATVTPTPGQTVAPTGILASFQLVNSRISKAAKKASGLGKPASNEAGMIAKITGDATLTVVARTQKGTKYGAISGARFSVTATAGTVSLRLSSTIGKAKLKAGLYRLTLLVEPKTGASDRRDFSIRVK